MHILLRALVISLLAYTSFLPSLTPVAVSQIGTHFAELTIEISPDQKAALDRLAARQVRTGQTGNIT